MTGKGEVDGACCCCGWGRAKVSSVAERRESLRSISRRVGYAAVCGIVLVGAGDRKARRSLVAKEADLSIYPPHSDFPAPASPNESALKHVT